MIRLPNQIAACAMVAAALIASAAANAQTTTPSANSSSGRLWGTSGSGNGSDSSTMHTLDGNAAAQVAAAKQGLLVGGTGASITAIGSQNIISNTIIGDNNSATVTGTQTSSNTGAISNNGSIAIR